MNKLIALIATAATLFASNAQAAAFECTSQIHALLVYADGTVNVAREGQDFRVVCNVKTEWRGVALSTCALWVSLMQDAKNRGKPVNFYYYGEDGQTCANMPTYWQAQAPVYIGRWG